MYNDFLGEVIAEETRIGKSKKPDYNNAITKQRLKLQKTIEAQSNELGRDKGDIGLEYVNQHLGDIQRYVTTKGEQPLSNPVELAVQAELLRKKDIREVQKVLGCNPKDAEVFLDEAESRAFEMNSSEADNFLGPLFAAIGGVVEKAADKQSAKRKAAGKKPGFWGFLSGKSGDEAGTNAQGLDAAGIKIFANDVINKIKENEKKKEIGKILPIAIVVIVVIILITILITRNASKNK